MVDKKIASFDPETHARLIKYIDDHQEKMCKAQRESFQRQLKSGDKIGIWVQREFYPGFADKNGLE